MKRNYFKFDIPNETIIGSETNIKKAGDPSSPQYKELCKMMKMQPSFKVAVKEIHQKETKETYKDLTFKAMRTFIESKNDKEALVDFEKLCAEGSYPTVKSWFLSKYKGSYKKTENKKAMTKKKITSITRKVAVQQETMRKGA